MQAYIIRTNIIKLVVGVTGFMCNISFSGIYDQDSPEEVLLDDPHLYAQGRTSSLYQPRTFWFNILDALYQSLVLFFISALVSHNYS